MEFNQNAQLDPSQVINVGGSGGGGRGGGLAIGGGLGLVITIIAVLLGRPDLVGLGGSDTGSQTTSASSNSCTSTSQINSNQECRWTAYVNSIQSFWATQFQQGQYTKVPMIAYSGQYSTACGTASSAVGPFYCPNDKKVYLDTAFADQLLQQLGAKGGHAAEAYIIAHEYGHHVQDLTGVLSKYQSNQTGPTSPSVRIELQADCYAGVWFKHAQSGQDAIISGISQDDLDRVVDAAAAVGDDRIEQSSSGRVTPESWTHGSAKMRQYWVSRGFSTGDPAQCNTFNTNNLEGN